MTAAAGKQTVLVICGTRPEAIKVAPIVRRARAGGTPLHVHLCSTGQHREMLDQVFEFFDLKPDIELNLMKPSQSLSGLAAAALSSVSDVLDRVQPAGVVVQGDTTTAFVAALAAFHHRVPVYHVEAGLRTGDLSAPFPEEANRRLISVVATKHFAPTERAAAALRAEGVRPEAIHLTGNTVVDALNDGLQCLAERPALVQELDARMSQLVSAWGRILDGTQRLVLITGHRRENFGGGMERICRAIGTLAAEQPGCVFVYPAHLNPNVQAPVKALLQDRPNVFVIDPIDYPAMLYVMTKTCLILTDSGGVQEEAPSLRIPVLVMRTTTERPELVEMGGSRLVGTDESAIVSSASSLLNDEALRQRMCVECNPYGDGHASDRILSVLTDQLAGSALARSAC